MDSENPNEADKGEGLLAEGVSPSEVTDKDQDPVPSSVEDVPTVSESMIEKCVISPVEESVADVEKEKEEEDSTSVSIESRESTETSSSAQPKPKMTLKASLGLGALLGQLRSEPASEQVSAPKPDVSEETEKTKTDEDSKAVADTPSSTNTVTVPSVVEDEPKPRMSYRAITSGLGALMNQLKSQASAVEPETEIVIEHVHPATSNYFKEYRQLESRNDEEEQQQVTPSSDNVDWSKLNRKERRAMQLQMGMLKRTEHSPPVGESSAASDSGAQSQPAAKKSKLQGPEEYPVFELPTAPEFAFPSCSQNELSKTFIRGPFANTSASCTFKLDSSNFSNNFVRGIRFSPCGRYLASDSQDNILRIFNVGSAAEEKSDQSSATLQQGGFVYDFEWNPNPGAELLASTSYGWPTHIYRSSGERLLSFKGINKSTETMQTAVCLAWMGDSQLATGYDKGVIRMFDINKPARPVVETNTRSKEYGGPRAKFSCLVSDQTTNLLITGTYTGMVSTWTSMGGGMWTNHVDLGQGAITQMYLSQNGGGQLFVAHRKQDSIQCFDMRMLDAARVLYTLQRPSSTNQKILFDVDRSGRWLASGATDGNAYVFDLADVSEEPIVIPVAECSVPSVSFHPTEPILAACSGERLFPLPLLEEDVEKEEVYESSQSLGYIYQSAPERLQNGIQLIRV